MKQFIQVMVVEDDDVDYRRVERALTRHDCRDVAFELVRATSMKSATEQLAEITVDVIMLDLNLPDSRGLKTVTEVQGLAPGVPIVALTGLDDDRVAINVVQAGAADYLNKFAFAPDTLIRMITKTIAGTAVSDSC